jgi:hypothetical protein
LSDIFIDADLAWRYVTQQYCCVTERRHQARLD